MNKLLTVVSVVLMSICLLPTNALGQQNAPSELDICHADVRFDPSDVGGPGDTILISGHVFPIGLIPDDGVGLPFGCESIADQSIGIFFFNVASVIGMGGGTQPGFFYFDGRLELSDFGVVETTGVTGAPDENFVQPDEPLIVGGTGAYQGLRGTVASRGLDGAQGS